MAEDELEVRTGIPLLVSVVHGTVESAGVQRNLPSVIEGPSLPELFGRCSFPRVLALHHTRWTLGGTRICLIVTGGYDVHPSVDSCGRIVESVDPASSILEKYMVDTNVSVSDGGTGTDPILTLKFTSLQLGTRAVFER